MKLTESKLRKIIQQEIKKLTEDLVINSEREADEFVDQYEYDVLHRWKNRGYTRKGYEGKEIAVMEIMNWYGYDCKSDEILDYIVHNINWE